MQLNQGAIAELSPSGSFDAGVTPAAVIQSDGKIVVVGGSHDSLGNQYLVLARYSES